MNKLKMHAEDLRVDSFPTAGIGTERGTVRAQAGCTYDKSCLCETAYYQCGTGPQTIYSCDYTLDCQRTVYAVCGTGPVTAE